jgi:hypothetical protein
MSGKKREHICLQATGHASDEQMEQARTRRLELLHQLEHTLASKQRTASGVARVAQGEEAGNLPHADSACDNGVRTLEGTRLRERKGKHWGSELERSRQILWQEEGQRIEEVATEFRQPQPESFRRVSVRCRHGEREEVWAFTQRCGSSAPSANASRSGMPEPR